MFALVTLLPLALATAVPARRDGTAMYKIHPVGNSTLCLGTSWASNGQPVFVVDCDEYFPGYQNEWSVAKGDNLGVRNNGLVHMWTCYPEVQQQHWYYTDDQHLAITGGNQCLDSGGDAGATQVQTYQCTGGNTNQMWDLELVQ